MKRNHTHYICKLDMQIYKCITNDLITDDVIITDKQIAHINKKHLNAYDKYKPYLESILKEPDYIISCESDNSGIIMKEFDCDDARFKLLLRIKTSMDDPSYKNSIITFMRIRVQDWKRIIRNKKILYSKGL